MKTRQRHRVIVDTSELAKAIGSRLKAARLRAGLTQQQLAEGRYTKAYVSALENGLVKPSMAALTYFAERLSVAPSTLMSDDAPQWSRLEADLLLAAGRWQEAADASVTLLAAETDRGLRAEILLGQAEALVRLDHAAEASAAAGEAADSFRALGREADLRRAEYWLAGAQHAQENPAEARALLDGVLAAIRGGLEIEPDFHLRVLMARSTIEAREGDHAKALAYLEEVRSLQDGLDPRRRATFLCDLAYSYRQTGDIEAAIRTGYQSLALFAGMQAEGEMAGLENDLALSFLEVANLGRARELATSAHARFERLGDERMLAHVTDTEARVELASGDIERARLLARQALDLGMRTDNLKAQIDALLTQAKTAIATNDQQEARGCYERAAAIARSAERPWRLREVLGEWADLLASLGEHREAYELSREALRAG
jgi:transcriptional regulator with XRE-family HTH domain